MKFKKLEVYGFKSFADKLEVKYGSGVTAIVGPNGCGKSNVADAIRWVLGEQSAKLLRGSSMQDVIFSGTEKRKSLSFCEVSLFFDNKDKLFPSLDYEEVVISRKLYRSGESEYSINKNVCRLKDITELLRDGGMGREGYSIIGQGRIDELLSAKPEDRRTIFEEAAGISKFKARKTEAERKLNRTRENLTRIDDIMQEKSKILEPMLKQSETAKKWLVMRDRLRHLEINKYIYQYDTASIAKQAIHDRLTGVLDELSFRQTEYDNTTKKYNDTMLEINSLDKTLHELREEHLHLTVGLERQSGEIKIFRERSGFFGMQNDKLREENIGLDRDYQLSLALIEQGEQTVLEKEQALCALKSRFETTNAQYLDVIGVLTEGEDEVQVNHLAVLDAMDKLADIKSNMSRLLAEKEGLQSVVEDLMKRSDALKKRIATHRAAADTLSQEIKTLQTHRTGQENELEKQAASERALAQQRSALNAELEKISNTLYAMKGRHKLLKEIQEAHEGFAYSVKKLLRDAKTDHEVKQRIEGLVAQIISVDKGFETAVEISLGGAVQNIVTKNEEDAKYLVEYLKRMRYGRATFLPMTSMKPRFIDGRYNDLLKTKGCFGVASDLVRFDRRYAGVVASLLGSTVIVDHMDTAIAIAKKSGFAFRIVTLEGDLVNPQGSISGGSKKSDSANIFAHDRELAELDAETEKLTAQTEALSLQKDKLELSYERTNLLMDEIHASIQKIDIEIAEKSESRSRILIEADHAAQEEESLLDDQRHNTRRIREIESDINSVEELEQIISSKKQSVSESSKEKQQEFDNLRKQRNLLTEQITDLRLNISGAENEIKSIHAEIERLNQTALSYVGKIEKNNVTVLENEQEIQNLNVQINAVIENSTDINADKIKSIKEKINGLDDYRQNLQQSLSIFESSRQELMEKVQNLFEKKNQEEFQLQKVDIDIEQMQTRIREEYNFGYEDCLPYKEEAFPIEEAVAEIGKLSRQMHALGNINLDAIDQAKEYAESYAEMESQREDLVTAEADLVQIITELSNEMLGRFNEEFSKIRANFVRIFKELFDGGTADLILLENDNPLEAGIEIVAQPPQKKLQSISLLSGGERALTAIAILFSILRLKPMPFCVLDEIEAALDDANAGRFAKYLRRFSEETQFIVITHRKPTMELADSLYGVTMEEKGVSKIVSVKLSDAIAHGEAAMGH